MARACLKKAFCKMCVTICGRFCPDEGAVAGYGNRIRAKYTAKWGVQIAEMIFQTRSRACLKNHSCNLHKSQKAPVYRFYLRYTSAFYRIFTLFLAFLTNYHYHDNKNDNYNYQINNIVYITFNYHIQSCKNSEENQSHT